MWLFLRSAGTVLCMGGAEHNRRVRLVHSLLRPLLHVRRGAQTFFRGVTMRLAARVLGMLASDERRETEERQLLTEWVSEQRVQELLVELGEEAAAPAPPPAPPAQADRRHRCARAAERWAREAGLLEGIKERAAVLRKKCELKQAVVNRLVWQEWQKLPLEQHHMQLVRHNGNEKLP